MTKAEEVFIEGKLLACPFCGHNRFARKRAQLNTRVATAFGLDWTNPQADAYICEQCGYICWFMPKSR